LLSTSYQWMMPIGVKLNTVICYEWRR